MLKRKIESVLAEWRNSESKKPLVIKGIRQCGKTYIINLDYIDKLSSNSAALTSGDNLVIPRTAFKGLQAAYFDYFGRR